MKMIYFHSNWWLHSVSTFLNGVKRRKTTSEHIAQLNKLAGPCQFYTVLWSGQEFIQLVVESVPGQQTECKSPRSAAQLI